LAAVQKQMERMQEQMNRVQDSDDPTERQRLLQEHWASMEEAMTQMHGMWGPGMMGCCGAGPGMMGRGMMGRGQGMVGPGMMGWPNMRGYYSQLTPEQLRQRQYMMDQYTSMQQQMMNHMLLHQQWMAPQQPAAR